MNMDIDAIRQAVEHASLLALGVAFLTGVVFSFNPVALASIPVALAYVTKARTTRLSLLFGGAFILGMILVQAALGFVAGVSGNWVASLAGRQWGLLLGPVLIALGAVFSVAVCPVCNPELVVLIGAAAASASPLFGASLLLAFAIGRAIPIALGASAVGWLENLKSVSPYQKPIEIVGGVTLIVFGLYMLNAYYIWIPELAL